MHKKWRCFPSRLCVLYARGMIECETLETESTEKEKVKTDLVLVQ